MDTINLLELNDLCNSCNKSDHIIKQYIDNISCNDENKYFILCLRACEQGHLSVVKFLINNYIFDTKKMKLIEGACYYGHLHILEYLYLLHPENFSPNNFYNQLLCYICEKGYFEILKFLSGISEHHIYYLCVGSGFCLEYIPIHFAFKHGHLHIIKYIIELNNNYHDLMVNNILPYNNHHPYKLACKFGRTDLINYLIQFYPKLYTDIKSEYNLDN
jgi:hypothetical protein